MRKLLLILTLICTLSVHAHVASAKFFDNTSIGVKGGVNTPLDGFFEGVSEQTGIQIEKGITPWLGFALDGDAFIHQPYGKSNPHTIFDGVNVNALAKFNLFNLFGNYPGYRRHFEWNVYTGIGWSHRTCKESLLFGRRNFGNYVAGTDFQFNLGKEKAWALVLSPEVNWTMPETGKLIKNHAMLEVNVGVVYHFKNKDGNRYFTKIKPYNQGEIDELNYRINELLSEAQDLALQNAELKKALDNVPEPKTIIETVENVVTIIPPVQFLFNSAIISETSYAVINEIAKYINTTDGDYTVVGYASNEGTEEYNIGLSARRAEAMVEALVNCGVSSERLTAKGEGITTQFSTTNPALNRVVIIK